METSNYLSWKERQRRMNLVRDELWAQALDETDDAGIRDRYSSLDRLPVRLITCPLVKDINQGGLLRCAESFRLERVVMRLEEGYVFDLTGNRGTEQWQPHRFGNVTEAISTAKSDGLRIVALTLSARSIPIQFTPWQFPMALVVGSENRGVPQDIADLADDHVAIPLFGLVQSLNVATATALALYEITNGYLVQNPEFKPARRYSKELLHRDIT